MKIEQLTKTKKKDIAMGFLIYDKRNPMNRSEVKDNQRQSERGTKRKNWKKKVSCSRSRILCLFLLYDSFRLGPFQDRLNQQFFRSSDFKIYAINLFFYRQQQSNHQAAVASQSQQKSTFCSLRLLGSSRTENVTQRF